MVGQLWIVLKPIINSAVPRMKALLGKFGVKQSDISPFLRIFDSVADLREAYLTCLPNYDTNSDMDVDDCEEQESEPDEVGVEVESENGDVERLERATNLAARHR